MPKKPFTLVEITKGILGEGPTRYVVFHNGYRLEEPPLKVRLFILCKKLLDNKKKYLQGPLVFIFYLTLIEATLKLFFDFDIRVQVSDQSVPILFVMFLLFLFYYAALGVICFLSKILTKGQIFVVPFKKASKKLKSQL